MEVAVGLVEDEGDAVLAGEGGEVGDERGRVLGAGRVVGGDEDDGAGPRGQAGAGGVGVGEHGVVAGERDGLDAAHVEPHLVVEVPGDGQHHRVAGGGEGGDGGAEGLVAAGGDGDVLGADVAAVAGGRAPGDLGAERGEAEDRAVEVGGCRRCGSISAIASRRASGGGSTGAAWERLMSGRSRGKSTPASQRRASMTGGGAVRAMSGEIGVMGWGSCRGRG